MGNHKKSLKFRQESNTRTKKWRGGSAIPMQQNFEFLEKNGKTKKPKSLKRKKSSGIEQYGKNVEDEFYDENFENNQWEDYMKLKEGEGSLSSNDDLEEMGLNGNAESSEESDEEYNHEDLIYEVEANDSDEGDEALNENRTNWGRKARNFYEDEQNEGSSDEEMELRAEEATYINDIEDAQNIQESDFIGIKQLSLLANRQECDSTNDTDNNALNIDINIKDDFFQQELNSLFSGFNLAKLEKKNYSKEYLDSLSLGEKQSIIQRHSPEFLPLLNDMKEKLHELNDRVSPLIEQAKLRQFITKEGISFINTKNQLLLCYLSYLSYYILLKCHGQSIQNHPLLKRLVELRTLFEKIRPIDQKLKYQVNKLLDLAQKSLDEVQKFDNMDLKPNPEQLVAGNDDSLDKENINADSEDENVNEKPYKPPQLLAVEYTHDHINAEQKAQRNLEREKKRLRKSEMILAMREELSSGPNVVMSNNWLEFEGESNAFLHKMREREKFEEENMLRLRSSKNDRKLALRFKEKLARTSGGTTLGELTTFAERAFDIDDNDPNLKTPVKKGNKPSLGSYLNAVRQAKEAMQKAHASKIADPNIQFRSVVKPSKRNEIDYNLIDETPSKPMERDLSEDDREFTELKQSQLGLKEFKALKMKKKAQKHLPKLDSAAIGKRGISRQIEKNKGLTRKRKKIEGNARVHNRQKFEKKMKAFKSSHPVMKNVEGDDYAGEKKGLRLGLKKSISLA